MPYSIYVYPEDSPTQDFEEKDEAIDVFLTACQEFRSTVAESLAEHEIKDDEGDVTIVQVKSPNGKQLPAIGMFVGLDEEGDPFIPVVLEGVSLDEFMKFGTIADMSEEVNMEAIFAEMKKRRLNS